MNTNNDLGLQTNPVITGLWQVADLERDGAELDRSQAAAALVDYVGEGYTCFDMADHYGSAELIAAEAMRLLKQQKHPDRDRVKYFTKWCPEPLQCSYDAVRAGVSERLERLNTDCIDLLQLHWWSFDHPGYIDVFDHLSRLQQDGLIANLGVTNFDTDHLHVLLSCGYHIASNQVCLSVLDRRALNEMSDVCVENDVNLLAYGTLAGGLLNERWLGHAQPADISDWSKMKYMRFIEAVGGWQVFQNVLATLNQIAVQHGVSIANVATRWVQQQAAVSGIIIGARLTESQHRDSNNALKTLQLTDDNLSQIDQLSDQLQSIAGDCGSEYRRPPFLTASGDLSHHLQQLPPVFKREPVEGKSDCWRISSGSEYEPVCGYSRGMRKGDRILISGTTATHGVDRVIGEDDLRAQMVYVMDKISASIQSLGGSLDDVVRTRIFLTDWRQWEVVSRVHGRYFSGVLPANTLVEVSSLVGPYAIEVEAEAIVD
jgi:aryl-alcohol dehydrogenase-like predicted oxidoreductase/enamine deaminase RidA (YjgF/YER057c/UK114 family)